MSRSAALAAAAALVFAAIFAFRYATGDEPSSDEGFYLSAAREAASGRIAYRDFGYPQAPLLPYVNGAAMSATGFGIVPQRLLDAGWALAGLAVLLATLPLSPAARLLLALFPLFSLDALATLSTGNTYGLASLSLALAAAAALCGRLPLAAACGALAIGVRLTTAAFVVPLLVLLAWRAPRRDLLAGVGTFVLALALVFGPFLIADAGNTLFWNLGYHLASDVVRWGRKPLLEAFRLAPLLPLLLLAAMPKLRGADRPRLALFLASISALAAQMLIRGAYGIYETPFVLVAAASALLLLDGARRSLFAALAVAGVVSFFVVRPVRKPDALADLHATAAFLRENTPPDAVVVTPLPEAAVEAGRAAVPVLGKFGYTDELPAEEAARRHLTAAAGLDERLASGRAGAVVLSSGYPNWNFWWSVPTLHVVRAGTRRAFTEALGKGYAVARTGPFYTVYLPRGAVAH